ncbi:serine hydrolase FSH [Roridomyces roridus]|uniref:Serine hydrolase FSH n=1 Tax=Roridomyces roridus TaxID=1738132 RepID=A0AAD7BSD1_9AGAR|nr:serine hydrolase FSH [Roridomyces roridus]
MQKTVLVLHGYTQNGNLFSRRLGALRKQAKNVDFVFIDGPIVLAPADVPGATTTLESLGASADAMAANESRAWWKWNETKSEPIGLTETLDSLRDLLKTRKFDGVMGFSQGAALAALLSALLERPHAYPPFLVDGQSPHPPFQFCVAVSGFRLRGTIPDAIFPETGGYTTPTLHIIGRNDIIVVEERSRKLVGASANARVEEHDGGHFVPSKGNWRKFLADYFIDPTDNVISPSLIGSADNSGAATPVESRTPPMKL